MITSRRAKNKAGNNQLLWGLGMGMLSFAVFFCSFAVVYSKHMSRQLFIQLQTLQQEIESLEVEWNQLLLEQGTWVSDARVERIARERLHMRLPEPNEVVVME